jgi:hypothetical protein
MNNTHNTRATPVTRRTVLAGLGSVGVGTAVGAGLGTSGFFSDRETARGTSQAGELDLKLDYRATYTPHVDAAETTARLLGDGRARELPDSDALLIGEMPALSTIDGEITAGEDGAALAGAEWSAFTLGYDACANPDALPYVDGAAGLAFDLDDVKPYDKGEVTLSVHVCDNPAYLWLRVADDIDAEMGRREPELELPDRPGGELDDYTWVRLWYDTDCSNTFDDREVLIYQGSLAGLREVARDGYALDPIRDAARDRDRSENPLSEGCVVVPGNPRCADYGLSRAIKIESEELTSGDYVTEFGTVSIEITDRRDGEATTVDVSAEFEFQGLIIKGGNAATVCGYPGGATRATGVEAPVNASGRPAAISHLSICVSDDPVADDRGICFDPGVACLGFEWYLPSFAVEDSDKRGFTDLPSDANVPDSDNDGVVTLADELEAKGLPVTEFTAINVVQSDAIGVRFDLAAVQCRHNMTNPNPFAATEGR